MIDATKRHFAKTRPGGIVAFLPVLVSFLVTGCNRVEYRPDPLDAATTQSSVEDKDIHDRAFLDYIDAVTGGRQDTAERDWDLQRLTQAAYYNNPRLRVAYEQLKASQARVRTASHRINPTLNLPLEHHSDTSGEQSSPWLFGLLLDFVYERPAKREARIDRAESRLRAARLHIREVAWDIRTRLQSAFLDYYAALQARRLAAGKSELLEQRRTILRQRYEAGQIGKASLADARIAARQADLDLARLDTQVGDKYHNLIAQTGLQADDFDGVTFEFGDFEDLSGITKLGKGDFRRRALLRRADINRALAEYQALEHGLRLEIEKQFPDIMLSPGLVFDQGDKIWALGSSWMLPLFQNNDGPIAEAMAERSVMQARILELQSGILNDLDAAADRFESLQGNLQLAREIRNEAEARSRAVQHQYAGGYSDRLQVVDAGLALLKSRQSLQASRVSLLETCIRLEGITQTPLRGDLDVERSMELLYSLNESHTNQAGYDR